MINAESIVNYDFLQENEFHLTQRQLECLRLIMAGMDYSDISNILQIGMRTVECHVYHIRKKLKCNNKIELINFVKTTGLLAPNPKSLECL